MFVLAFRVPCFGRLDAVLHRLHAVLCESAYAGVGVGLYVGVGLETNLLNNYKRIEAHVCI